MVSYPTWQLFLAALLCGGAASFMTLWLASAVVASVQKKSNRIPEWQDPMTNPYHRAAKVVLPFEHKAR